MRPLRTFLLLVCVTILIAWRADPIFADVVLADAERAFIVESDTTSDEKEDDQFFDQTFFHFNDLDHSLTASAGIFNASALSIAAQQSTISSTLFQANGTTDVNAASAGEDIFASAFAETYYTIFFDVTEPTWVHLTGSLTATSYADAELQLEDPNFDLLFDFYVSDGTQKFDETILLQPGFYTFSTGTTSGVDFKGFGDMSAAGEFSVQFTVIPAPSVGVVFAGLLLGGRRTRRRALS